MCFYSLFSEGVQKVFGTLDLFVSLLETEIKYPILQGGILPFWTPSLQVLIGDFFQHIDGRNYGLDKIFQDRAYTRFPFQYDGKSQPYVFPCDVPVQTNQKQ